MEIVNAGANRRRSEEGEEAAGADRSVGNYEPMNTTRREATEAAVGYDKHAITKTRARPNMGTICGTHGESASEGNHYELA